MKTMSSSQIEWGILNQSVMRHFNVIYKEKNSNAGWRGGYSCNASCEAEAIAKWEKSDYGKLGRNEIVEVREIF